MKRSTRRAGKTESGLDSNEDGRPKVATRSMRDGSCGGLDDLGRGADDEGRVAGEAAQRVLVEDF